MVLNKNHKTEMAKRREREETTELWDEKRDFYALYATFLYHLQLESRNGKEIKELNPHHNFCSEGNFFYIHISKKRKEKKIEQKRYKHKKWNKEREKNVVGYG